MPRRREDADELLVQLVNADSPFIIALVAAVIVQELLSSLTAPGTDAAPDH